MRAFSLIGLLLVAGILAYVAMNQVSAGKKAGAGQGVPGADASSPQALQRDVERAQRAVATDSLEATRRALVMFKAQEGKFPDALEQLVEKGFIDHVPPGLNYDPASGTLNP